MSYEPGARFCPRDGATLDDKASRYDAFVSYRRENGSHAARVIRMMVEKLSEKKLFLDVDELGQGRFDERLLGIIESTPSLILILSPGSLERCANEADWLAREVTHAFERGKTIIPVVVDGFAFPDSKTLASLPPAIAGLSNYQAVSYEHHYAEAAARKILAYMSEAEHRTGTAGTEASGASAAGSRPEASPPRPSGAAKASPPEVRMKPVDFAVSPGGESVVIGDVAGRIVHLDLGNRILSESKTEGLSRLEVSPNGRHFATWESPREFPPPPFPLTDVTAFALPGLERRLRVAYHQGDGPLSAFGFGFDAKGDRLAVLGQNIQLVDGQPRSTGGTLVLLDLEGESIARVTKPFCDGHGRLVSLSPDGEMVAIQSNGKPAPPGALHVFSTRTGEPVRVFGPKDLVDCQVMSWAACPTPDWQYVIHGRPGGGVIASRFTDAEPVSQLVDFMPGGGQQFHLFLSPSGDRGVWTDVLGRVRLFSLPDVREEARLTVADRKGSMAWRLATLSSQDELVCVYCCPLGDAHVFTRRGEPVAHFQADRFTRCQFSGKRLFALEGTGRLVAWDTKTWSVVFEYLPPS
jgi:hypothetical protein